MGKVVQIARIKNSLETQCYLTQAQRQTATAEQLGQVLVGETEGLLDGSKGEGLCTRDLGESTTVKKQSGDAADSISSLKGMYGFTSMQR